MKDGLLYESLICCQPQNLLTALKINNTCRYASSHVTASDLTHIFTEREREEVLSHWSVASERGVGLRSLLFLSHTPPPLIFSEGIPPPLLFDSSLLLPVMTSSAISLREGRSFSWLLDSSCLPHIPRLFSLSLGLIQSPVRYL